MSDSTTPSPTSKGSRLRLGMIGVGVVVFLLLFFADKTNLNNPDKMSQVSSGVKTNPSNSQSSSLPPLAPDQQFDQWKSQLNEASEEAKKVLLDSMVTSLVERKRYGHAAEYVEQLLELDRSLDIQLLAGKMNQKATELKHVGQDSVLFRKFSNRAITYLTSVTTAKPDNEEGLLYLGLALAQSRQPQNMMQGILNIRKVLEINPDNVDAGFRLGLFSLQTNQLDKAEQRFSHILSVDPAHHPSRFQLAVTRIQQQRPEEAKELFNQVIQESSDAALKLEARELLLSLNSK
ncbi:MAG: tetratricopeptide repeat protein [Bacteroidota bacterium]